MSPSELQRPLSPAEVGAWVMDKSASMNYCLVARVRGGLDPDTLRVALDSVQARHPALRARVDELEAQLQFRSGGIGALPLVQERAPEDGWLPHLEREIHAGFPPDGPLLRVLMLHHGDNACTLLMTSHHVIGDGRSGIVFLRDLLQSASAQLAGLSPVLPELCDVTPMDERLPAHARGLRGVLGNLRFVLRSLLAAKRLGSPISLRVDQPRSAHERRTRICPVVLDAQRTRRLLDRCRAEGTTVQGALAAAMILGILRDHDVSGPVPVSFGNPVDMRSSLEPAVGDVLGFFVSMVPFEGRVAADDDLWALARGVRANIQRALKRREEFGVLAMSPRLVGWCGGGRLSPEAFAEAWESKVHGTAGLTNMGRADLPTQYGPLSLETCHYGLSPSVLGQFTAVVTTLSGQLYWNFCWPDPTLTEEHAESLVQGILAALDAALDA